MSSNKNDLQNKHSTTISGESEICGQLARLLKPDFSEICRLADPFRSQSAVDPRRSDFLISSRPISIPILPGLFSDFVLVMPDIRILVAMLFFLFVTLGAVSGASQGQSATLKARCGTFLNLGAKSASLHTIHELYDERRARRKHEIESYGPISSDELSIFVPTFSFSVANRLVENNGQFVPVLPNEILMFQSTREIGIAQIRQSLSVAAAEHSWAYIPEIGVWFDITYRADLHNVTDYREFVDFLLETYMVIEHFHTHPDKTLLDSYKTGNLGPNYLMEGARPSGDDFMVTVPPPEWIKKNLRKRLVGHVVSHYGITAYEIMPVIRPNGEVNWGQFGSFRPSPNLFKFKHNYPAEMLIEELINDQVIQLRNANNWFQDLFPDEPHPTLSIKFYPFKGP